MRQNHNIYMIYCLHSHLHGGDRNRIHCDDDGDGRGHGNRSRNVDDAFDLDLAF